MVIQLRPLLCVALLAGCASAPESDVETDTEADAGPKPSGDVAEVDAAADAPADPVGSTFAPSTKGPTAAQVTDETLMYAMAGTRLPTGQPASVVAMRLDGSDKWVAPLIEMVRVAGEADSFGTVLGEITGQNFGMNWPEWVEWYGTTDLEPPYGFARWKGELLAEFTGHKEFTNFLTKSLDSRIRVEEIVWGGVGPDQIPPLENPTFLAADATDFYDPNEFVLGVSIGGDHRAYPLRILNWHELVNDVVGGVPVSLAYCTLCGAGVLYDTTLYKGETREEAVTFGTSGLLMRSNKLMYDRPTESLWNQITGEPVTGELAHSGLRLERLPITTSTWGEWKALHPDTKVLSPDTGHARDYSPGKPYGEYFASDQLMFPVWRRSNKLDKKDVVFVMDQGGVPRAWPLKHLKAGVLADRVGDTDVVLVVGDDAPRTDEPAGRSVRAYEALPGVVLSGTASALKDASGGAWTLTESHLEGPDGARMERLPGHLAFWFGWFAYFPQTELYTP